MEKSRGSTLYREDGKGGRGEERVVDCLITLLIRLIRGLISYQGGCAVQIDVWLLDLAIQQEQYWRRGGMEKSRNFYRAPYSVA